MVARRRAGGNGRRWVENGCVYRPLAHLFLFSRRSTDTGMTGESALKKSYPSRVTAFWWGEGGAEGASCWSKKDKGSKMKAVRYQVRGL